MRAGEIGGNVGTIAEGGASLARQATNVGAASAPLRSALTSAAGACGAADLQTAIDRCSAAWSTEIADLGVALHAAATLASHAAQDLQVTGGP